jgi:hypothetical protein
MAAWRSGMGTIHKDYNWYSGASTNGEAHSVAGGAANPFVGASLANFHLLPGSSPINAGLGLASDGSLNKDADGNTRGADGAWDMGAFEYKP